MPTRELMPTREQREMLKEGETYIDSADELIEPERPERSEGPRIKRKLEVIECPTSIEIERELRSRPREEDIQLDESDHLPKMKVVYMSEDEAAKVTNPRKKKINRIERIEGEGRPKRWRQVSVIMKTGEVIFGRISEIEKSNQFFFFMNNEFEMYLPIDIREVKSWNYEDNP